jgi:secreted trypsin-like serine protease
MTATTATARYLCLGATLAALLACLGAPAPATAASLPVLAQPTPVQAPPRPQSVRVAPQIIGGQEISIEQVPWQVFVLVLTEGEELACGGSILNATEVLTAAHCVTHEGTNVPFPAEAVNVIAGASNVAEATESLIVPSGAQSSKVEALRIHPYFGLSPIHDDAAVLTLRTPLNLAGPAAKAIPLVGVGETPPTGTPLSLSGYGKENGAENALPSWRLNFTALTALGSDPCRETVGGESAVLVCAVSSGASACQGDSGGPLTEGNPALEVGIVDYGPIHCPVGQPDAYTNVAAPEVRDFIEGSETPPRAARITKSGAFKWLGPTPVTFSPETCEGGEWSGSPTFTYTFQSEGASPQVFQSGSSNVFMPQPNAVGSSIVCVVQASNAGGVTTVRSVPGSPPLVADTGQPQAAITGLSCHGQTCTMSVAARDPFGSPLSVQGTAIYLANTTCPPKKAKRHSKAKPQTCQKAVNMNVAATAAAAGSYRVSLPRLPYNETVIFRALVTNAAGLRPTSAPVRAQILRKPAAKPKKHSGASHKGRHHGSQHHR